VDLQHRCQSSGRDFFFLRISARMSPAIPPTTAPTMPLDSALSQLIEFITGDILSVMRGT